MSYAGIFTDKNNTDHPVTSTLYGTCSTAAATADKVVVCSNVDVLTNGMTLRVVFENGNTASDPTLNVNSLGAKAVYRFGTTKPVGDSSWEAGAVVDLMYNGTSFYMLNSDDIGSIKSDISTKQDATDNTLETTDKTVSGAINEVNDGVETLDAWTSADTKTVTGNPITLTDAAAVKAKALSMSIVPDQNLHGFDHPWVGGAGKNKLNPTGDGGTYSVYTVTKDEYGRYTVSGGGTTESVVAILAGEFNVKANTEYTLNGCPQGGGNSSYRLDIRTNTTTVYNNIIDRGDGITFTADADATLYVYMRFDISYVISGSLTFAPMIRLATETDATFAPYTNICPITGHTEASVQRDGKNLFDVSTVELHKSINDVGFVYPTENYNLSDYIRVSGTKLIVSGDNKDKKISFGFYDKNKEWFDFASSISVNTAVTIPNGTAYVRFDVYKDSENIQLELGQTATDYEPFKGKTYTIALGDTIYGGTVRIDSNGNTVMDVDRGIVNNWDDATLQSVNEHGIANYQIAATNKQTYGFKLNSCLPWQTGSIADVTDEGVAWNHSSIWFVRVENSKYATLADFKTWANANLQICYELATPFTVQLTPTQIQLLKGTNTLTANGATISLTYQQDNLAGDILEQVEPLIDDHEERIEAVESSVAVVDVSSGITANDDYVESLDTKAVYKIGRLVVGCIRLHLLDALAADTQTLLTGLPASVDTYIYVTASAVGTNANPSGYTRIVKITSDGDIKNNWRSVPKDEYVINFSYIAAT